MTTPMLDCDAVMRELWDYLDGELTPERMHAIGAHVAVCARCYPQYQFERSFVAALEQARREWSPASSLRDRVQAALREAGLAGV